MVDIVCAGGWLMGPEIWDSIPDLGGRFRVHAIPQPGHGVPNPPDGFTVEDWADWLVAEADRRGVGRAIFAGHSMGGYVVQNVLARHRERVLGMILVGTTDEEFPDQTKRDFIDLADGLMFGWGGPLTTTVTDLLLGRAFTAANPEWVQRWHERVADEYNLGGIASLARAISYHPDMRDVMRTVDVPTAVIHGADDAAVPPQQGRELASRIPGASFHLVDGSGHCPALERPAEFRALAGAFLERSRAEPVPL